MTRTCGAYKQDGEKCDNPALPGSKRCGTHGPRFEFDGDGAKAATRTGVKKKAKKATRKMAKKVAKEVVAKKRAKKVMRRAGK